MGRMAKEEACEVLGLKGGETEEEIKRAYRKMSLATHPDKNPVRGIDMRMQGRFAGFSSRVVSVWMQLSAVSGCKILVGGQIRSFSFFAVLACGAWFLRMLFFNFLCGELHRQPPNWTLSLVTMSYAALQWNYSNNDGGIRVLGSCVGLWFRKTLPYLSFALLPFLAREDFLSRRVRFGRDR